MMCPPLFFLHGTLLLLFHIGFIYSLTFPKMCLMWFSDKQLYNEVNEPENLVQKENKREEDVTAGNW